MINISEKGRRTHLGLGFAFEGPLAGAAEGLETRAGTIAGSFPFNAANRLQTSRAPLSRNQS